VIERVQQWYQGLVHTASAGRSQRYSSNGGHSTQFYRQSIRNYNQSTETHRGSIQC
jgi:hypothetical protein